jgi:antitoxin component YwqK of YwqJK toxin-antitoxin module
MLLLLLVSLIATANCYYGKVNKNKAGNDDGKKLCFFDEAMKKSAGFETYKDGKRDGPTVYYRSDGSGKLAEELNYKADVQHGLQRRYYEQEGVFGVRRTTVFDNGTEVGPMTDYFKSGGRSTVIHMSNNLGEYRTRAEYYENGALRSVTLQLGNQFGDVARIDYAVSGRIVKMMCQPPGKGYIYKLEDCQKYFKFSLAGLANQLKT